MHIRNGKVVLDADGAGTSTDPARLTTRVKDDSIQDGRRYLDNLDAGALTTTFAGGAAINLPTFFPTVSNPVGSISLNAPNLLNPGNFTVSTPDFTSALNNFNPSLDLSALTDGMDAVLGLLEQQVGKKLKSIKLPVIGSQISQVVDVLSDLRGRLDSLELDGLNASAVEVLLEQHLSQYLSPAGVTLTTAPGAIPQFVQYDMVLADDIVIANVPFDLGLPGLASNLLMMFACA